MSGSSPSIEGRVEGAGAGSVRTTLAGQSVILDHAGCLLFPDDGTLVVADLHFEKGSAFAARGDAWLPPYDTAATIGRLEQVCRRYRPRRVVSLGDTLHDLAGAERMPASHMARLRRLVDGHDWLWVAGNHDPAPPPELGGAVAPVARIGDVMLRHDVETAGEGGLAAGEVIGHYHPKAAVRTRGRRIGGRCFATDGRRMILPAFGAYAGGLNVLDPAISGLLAPAFRVFLIGRERLFAFRRQQLAPEPRRAA